ncbi:MAG: S8 family serine peptidase [Planctomycetes bacterium]|nr:S8 family serine peptidase [Planctomycetota bacterium]
MTASRRSLTWLSAMACGVAITLGPGVLGQNWDDRETVCPDVGVLPLVRYDRLLVDADTADWEALAADHGLGIETRLPDLNVFVAVVRGEERQALAADPRVRSLSEDTPFEIAGACCGSDEASLDPAALDRAHEELAKTYGALRALPQRRTVLLAVLDTGLDTTHPDLGNHQAGRSFVPGSLWNKDRNGHGTAMASLAAGGAHGEHEHGEHEGGELQLGVAPAARILPVRVADDRGRARASQVAAGIAWATNQGADVILIALGSRQRSAIVESAVGYAEERGTLVVAAAGNENTHTERYPAADPRVIGVGSLDRDGGLAITTAFAPSTDLLAVGVNQLAAVPQGRHAHVTGTSAAAARTAGLVALAKATRPQLGPGLLRGLLRGARRPLFSEPDLAAAFSAGPLDLDALREALATPAPLLRLSAPHVFPTRARAGASISLQVAVTNDGLRDSESTTLTIQTGGDRLEAVVPALAPGARHLVRLEAQARPGRISFSCADSSVECSLGLQTTETFRDRAITAVSLEGRQLVVSLVGRGSTPMGGAIRVSLGERDLGSAKVAALAAGEERTLLIPFDAARVPSGVQQVRVGFVEADDVVVSDAATLDLCLRPERTADLTTQYQQSGLVNVVSDAPWRIAPGRSWVPVLVFVPEKGDLDPNTALELTRVRLQVREVGSLAAAPDVIYDDVVGSPTIAPQGLVILEENGFPQTLAGNGVGAPDLRLFKHQPVSAPGRYAILRVPRAAFGVPAASAWDEVRYLEVITDWRLIRGFLNSPRTVKRGQASKVMEIRFAANARPQLAGGGGYYDAHVHTVAEWYQDQAFDVLAPRKNWGGPLPMLAESAYAIGMIDSLTGVKDRVITTDHNTFYADGDTFRDRPLWGPTSVGASAGLSEWDRMGELFGITRGEEVAFKGESRINALLNLPVGAHALTYRARHVEGPWHGGSDIARTLGDSSADLTLNEVIRQLAQTSPRENAKAAIYAAHPFAGTNTWTEDHLEIAFERDPNKRTDRTVKLGERGFITKGLQIWNADFGRHQLPSNSINFDVVNPYTNTQFLQGNPDWDRELITGLERWHRDTARLMEYELKGLPGVRFPRKMFISAGSDAHGDFNMTEDRLTTMFDVKSSFLLDKSAFGRVMTYSLPPTGARAGNEERLEAMLDGNSVLTDGPLLRIDLDAEDRFDARTLRWTELAPAYRDADGRIGGGGAFDGMGTALVRRGSPNARIGYQYSTTPEWGEIKAIALHRTSSGDPSVSGKRPSGAPYIEPRGWLEARGADVLQSEALNPFEEGTIQTPTAISAAAYTGGAISPGVDDARCLTNAIWAIPFDAEAVVGVITTGADGKGSIAPGQLVVRFDFDMSLEPADYRIEIKALNAQGESSEGTTGPIDVLVPASGSGWAGRPGFQSGSLTVVNQRSIPLDLDRFGGLDEVRFVIYFYDAPRDHFGNELNRIAFTFDVLGQGAGGGTGPELDRAGATTAAPATVVASGTTSGSGGGGGCSLSTADDPRAPWAALLLLLTVLAGWRRLGATTLGPAA